MAAEEDSSQFGEYITSEYEILRRVFSYLSVAELSNCMSVCINWKEAALLTLKPRRLIQCLVLRDINAEPDLYSDSALTLSFQATAQPNQGEQLKSARLSKEMIHFVARFGIIGVVKDLKPIGRRYRQLPLRIHPHHVAVRFPPVPGSFIQTISLNFGLKSEEECAALINLPEDVPIKAVVMVTFGDFEDETEETVRNLRKAIERRSPTYAYGGCILDVSEQSNEMLKCIIFAGEKFVTASCVLDQGLRVPEDIDTRVQAWSEKIEKVKNSVILVFRCCDRQRVQRRYNYKPGENLEKWESTSIQTHFPDTPAVGCYGIGEFGLEYPRKPEPNPSKQARIDNWHRRDDHFALSTALLYIGYKH